MAVKNAKKVTKIISHSKKHIFPIILRKTHVKFLEDLFKTVGGVAGTKCILLIHFCCIKYSIKGLSFGSRDYIKELKTVGCTGYWVRLASFG